MEWFDYDNYLHYTAFTELMEETYRYPSEEEIKARAEEIRKRYAEDSEPTFDI